MPNLSIAVIDSGVDPLSLRHAQLHHSLRITRSGKRLRFQRSLTDPIGHGTACVELIGRLVPQAEISSLAITDDQGTFEPEALEHAIGWCIDGCMRIVNVSLGTTDPKHRAALESICTRAAAAGVIIVAADHNEGLVSYPAHCEATMAVAAGRLASDGDFIYRPDHPVQCIARGDRQRVRWRGGEDRMVGGSSFAAPRMVAVIAHLLSESSGADQIHELLRRAATTVRIGDNRTQKSAPPPPHMLGKRAALYPFTKEMHSLVRFRDLLDFDIVGIADPPGRRGVGQDAGTAIRQSPMGVTISASLPRALKSAEILVLGYTRKLGTIQRKDALREAVDHALRSGTNVFSFESVDSETYPDLHQRAKEKGLTLHSPGVTLGEAQEYLNRSQAEPEVDRPVLGVFGTSSSQGKFTLQLALRRELQQQGYRIGQVGTEHHAELFGMDISFPMGYDSRVELPMQHWPMYLDRRLRQLCREQKPDLVIVGSQSGTIPYNVDDQRTLTLPSLAFLIGTKPDACILVVNAADEESYVRATITTLESLAQTQVLALAISDQSRTAGERHGRSWVTSSHIEQSDRQGILDKLTRAHHLPAFCMGDVDGVQSLTNLVLSYFGPAQTREAA